MEMVSVLNRLVSDDFNEKVTVFVRFYKKQNHGMCNDALSKADYAP